MDQEEILKRILNQVAEGDLSPDRAWDKLQNFGFETLEEFAKIDHHRNLRNGFPEVIWGAGKTTQQIIKIIKLMEQRNQTLNQQIPIMATLIEPEIAEELQAAIPNLQHYPLAKIVAIADTETIPKQPGIISIVTAGTSDIPIAEQAAVTAELSGFQVTRLWDVGVAGIHRLLGNWQYLTEADVLIVIAGMEGALPSVVAGLVDCPVIAVPTSVGYGASFGGISALLTMLNSCASGIGVVNIDNGFGAAILAGQILRTAKSLNTEH
ncbi:NCAIR mutase-like protein [Xenococcus sp. PCC 7305]|uniref:nickel pincer cofactor biosynthesis protein LarB n=1 Tax=Xenococcus sp. PCC 7305 TaxID=102125 RepID=UPI0002ABB632|nr:nickel pincer cofactor biosynthesis protein LarB [Xenococcus sp. PCC 7305]ELS03071.1 NCAIR mutase-like protein [Xenococcus sp. PCC 7305]